MATVSLPISNDPWSELQVKLDGVGYTIELRWNTRASAWFMELRDTDDNVLVTGRKITVDWPLINLRDNNPLLPPGQLYAYDTSGQSLDPTLDDLGTRVVLLYLEATA